MLSSVAHGKIASQASRNAPLGKQGMLALSPSIECNKVAIREYLVGLLPQKVNARSSIQRCWSIDQEIVPVLEPEGGKTCKQDKNLSKVPYYWRNWSENRYKTMPMPSPDLMSRHC